MRCRRSMGEYPSRTSHTSRCFRTSICFTALTYTLAQLQTCSCWPIYDSVLNTWRAWIRISCCMDSIIQLWCTSHLIDLSCFQKIRQGLEIENVPAQISTTIFLNFVNFCTIYSIQALFLCSAHMKNLKPDSTCLTLYLCSSCRSWWMLNIRFVYPESVVFIRSAAS